MQIVHYQATDLMRGSVSVPKKIYQRFEFEMLECSLKPELEAMAWSEPTLSAWVRSTVDEVAKHLGRFDGTVHLVPARKPPAWAPIPDSDWTTGFSPAPDVWLSVPPNPSELHFRSVLAHELHHVLTPMPKRGTVGNWLKVEGLAETFALHLYPQERWHWRLLPPENGLAYVRQVLRHLDDDDFMTVGTLLNGDPEEGVPHFAGYTYGYRAVNRYRAAHPKTTWAQLTKVSARKLLTT